MALSCTERMCPEERVYSHVCSRLLKGEQSARNESPSKLWTATTAQQPSETHAVDTLSARDYNQQGVRKRLSKRRRRYKHHPPRGAYGCNFTVADRGSSAPAHTNRYNEIQSTNTYSYAKANAQPGQCVRRTECTERPAQRSRATDTQSGSHRNEAS